MENSPYILYSYDLLYDDSLLMWNRGMGYIYISHNVEQGNGFDFS